jgi:chromosome segregation ATPase
MRSPRNNPSSNANQLVNLQIEIESLKHILEEKNISLSELHRLREMERDAYNARIKSLENKLLEAETKLANKTKRALSNMALVEKLNSNIDVFQQSMARYKEQNVNLIQRAYVLQSVIDKLTNANSPDDDVKKEVLPYILCSIFGEKNKPKVITENKETQTILDPTVFNNLKSSLCFRGD